MFYIDKAMYKINNAEVGSAVSVRPSSTALFTINSADRYGTIGDKRDSTVFISPYDFTIRKNESLLNGFFTRMAVTEVVFPVTLPNVSGSTNYMAVTIQVGSASPTSSIYTPGASFFTPPEIAADLQTYLRTLDASLSGATCVYGATGNPQFVIDANTATTSITFSPVAQNTTNFPYSSDQIQLFDMFGFTAANCATNGSGLLFSQSTFFQKYQYFDIVSTLLTGNQNLKDSTTSPIDRTILCRLYVDYENSYNVPASNADFAPAGTTPITIYRKFPVPKFVQWDVKQPVGQLNFQVYDQDGVLLDPAIFGSMDWKMSVLVSEQ